MKNYFYPLVSVAVILIGWLLFRAVVPSVDVPRPLASQSLVGWFSFTSPSQLYQVSFPQEPKFLTQVHRDSFGNAERSVEGASSKDLKDGLFLVRVIRSHKEILESRSFLDGTVASWKEKYPSLSLIETTKEVVDGIDAMFFTVAGPSIRVRGSLFSKGGDLFLLARISSSKDEDEANFLAFLNSFKLLD